MKMPSKSNIIALVAALAIATLPASTLAAKESNLRRKKRRGRNLRRGQIKRINSSNRRDAGKGEELEDVEFWTNISRNLQSMSVPTTPNPITPFPSESPVATPAPNTPFPTGPPVSPAPSPAPSPAQNTPIPTISPTLATSIPTFSPTLGGTNSGPFICPSVSLPDIYCHVLCI